VLHAREAKLSPTWVVSPIPTATARPPCGHFDDKPSRCGPARRGGAACLREGAGAGEHRATAVVPVELLRLRRWGLSVLEENPRRKRQAPARSTDSMSVGLRATNSTAARRRGSERTAVGCADHAAGLQRPARRRGAVGRRRAPRPPGGPPRAAHQPQGRPRRARAPLRAHRTRPRRPPRRSRLAADRSAVLCLLASQNAPDMREGDVVYQPVGGERNSGPRHQGAPRRARRWRRVRSSKPRSRTSSCPSSRRPACERVEIRGTRRP
jgi:hypothetical protein